MSTDLPAELRERANAIATTGDNISYPSRVSAEQVREVVRGLLAYIEELEASREAAALEARAPLTEEKLREILADELTRHGVYGEGYLAAYRSGEAEGGCNENAALAAMRRVSTRVVPAGSGGAESP
jgi:hypothetical protein